MIQRGARASQQNGFKAMDFKKKQETICKDFDKLGMNDAIANSELLPA